MSERGGEQTGDRVQIQEAAVTNLYMHVADAASSKQENVGPVATLLAISQTRCPAKLWMSDIAYAECSDDMCDS